MSESFITGSRAFGRPTTKSDVDLVIRCSPETKKKLTALSDLGKGSVRFGKLNLVLCTTDEEFAVWKLGTASLVREKVSKRTCFDKVKATMRLDTLRKMLGMKPQAKPATKKFVRESIAEEIELTGSDSGE